MSYTVAEMDAQGLRHFEEATGESHLLQSMAWKQFQDALGRKTRFLAIKRDLSTRLVALVIQTPLPLGRSQLYIPRGPLLAAHKMTLAEVTEVLTSFMTELQVWAKENNAIFARLDPALSKHFHHFFTQLGAVDAPHDMSPRRTSMIDLTKSSEGLLAAMKPKTRYNIRLAAKKGVSVRISETQSDMTTVLDILHDTAKRDGFSLHEDHYYRKQLDILGPLGHLKLFLAELDGKVIAANLVSLYRNQMIYLHGGSRSTARDAMAPYALHWAAIEYGKEVHAETYDLWGIAPTDDADHPWAGITRFKQGFGGTDVSTVGTLDLPFDGFWYGTYKVSKKWLS